MQHCRSTFQPPLQKLVLVFHVDLIISHTVVLQVTDLISFLTLQTETIVPIEINANSINPSAATKICFLKILFNGSRFGKNIKYTVAYNFTVVVDNCWQR